MPIIEVNHLTKEYQLGSINGLKQNALNFLARLQGKPVSERENFRALNDVSFTIEEGEVVGIIGHNGAGKSTLLKHLADISKPTAGEVIVRGSVAPLIEVGAGVNPELTGRENIFLNGAILGIPKKIIKRKLDEIIEFSELEQFIDTPVKRYSSGMTVKLGFSIATSMDADILIVDEVLAVGDLAFQRKCFDRMEDLIKHQGKTVLIVSHNLRQIERLCSRAICLGQGQVVMDATARETCEYFYQYNDKKIANQAKINSRYETSGEVELTSCQIFDESGNEVSEVGYRTNPQFKFTFNVHETLTLPSIVFGFHTTDFIFVATYVTSSGALPEELQPGMHEFQFRVNDFPLIKGVFGVRVAVDAGDPVRNALYADNVAHFLVTNKYLNKNDIAMEGFVSLDVDII